MKEWSEVGMKRRGEMKISMLVCGRIRISPNKNESKNSTLGIVYSLNGIF